MSDLPPTGGGGPSTDAIEFEVWGSRGSRNLAHDRSRIALRTSCYSVRGGEDLYTFDAGSGLRELGSAMLDRPRLAGIKRVHVLVTHAHADHWEGLKDVEWFWTRGNGLSITIYGPDEAILAINSAFEPPSYVALEVLAMGTVSALAKQVLHAGQELIIGGARLEVFPMHHYSGMGDHKRHLDALGYLLTLPVVGAPAVAYLSDHEPTPATLAKSGLAYSTKAPGSERQPSSLSSRLRSLPEGTVRTGLQTTPIWRT